MTPALRVELLALVTKWMNTGGRAPNEVENERRKCARELERLIRSTNEVA